ncbi:hypothetical protein [Paraglaciecola sp. 20A4]|uniref:hypothetical protein n=1 Tax=Paraglaciecola sp. 20A4 TaxID=2687288 RepID=UPI001408FB01|nr:hypothetical protein [Paraglaciecola sp. 20A4]
MIFIRPREHDCIISIDIGIGIGIDGRNLSLRLSDFDPLNWHSTLILVPQTRYQSTKKQYHG